MKIPVVRLDQELPLPSYTKPGDAAMDLRARSGGVLAPGGGRGLFPTGIALALPPAWAALIRRRWPLLLLTARCPWPCEPRTGRKGLR